MTLETLLQMPPAERQRLFAEMIGEGSHPELQLLEKELSPVEKARLLWLLTARPEQLTPAGDWTVWLQLGGRGSGKTRAGAEDLLAFAWDHPRSRLAVIAPTHAAGRDVCIEGESGIRACVPPSVWDRTTWNRSLGELVLPNKTHVKVYSSEEPERLRGPQHHRIWADELAAWRYASETLDMAMLGLRLGESPRIVVTTTPKPTPIVKKLVSDSRTHVSRMSTFDNLANLAPTFQQAILERYEGTRLGRQELYGELLEDVDGALWTVALLDATRVPVAPALERVVVAVDPAVTTGEDADSTGIVVAGKSGAIPGTGIAHAYVLDDLTCRLSPEASMRRAIGAYYDHGADALVVERNNGGDFIPALVRTIDDSVNVRTVVATRGKRVRAEPVAALWEQQRGHVVGVLPDLEEQLTSWAPDSPVSPDRLDALVWAITALLVPTPVFLGAA